jgi:hypothetical protein
MSTCTTPTLIVFKKDGQWKMCIYSKAPNKIKIKYNFPLFRMDNLVDSLSGIIHFIKIYLNRSDHNSIKIKKTIG